MPGARPHVYTRAIAAELAVLAGLPDAADRLAAAGAEAGENDWALACLDRARPRLSGDPGRLAASIECWERIGARFERAETLLLIPDHEAEGRTELAALGVPDRTAEVWA